MTLDIPRKSHAPSLPALRRWLTSAVFIALGLASEGLPARQAPPVRPLLTRTEGLAVLDYETIPVQREKPIDLMGFHYLKRLNGWLYLGVGGHAPLLKGDYGGFMAFDATLHAQHRLSGRLFAEAGISLGGGAGGRSAQQSKTISGSGALSKTYLGLGYGFRRFSVGVNYTRFRFEHSAIDHSQADVYLQVPFSMSVGPYGRPSEERFSQVEADDLLDGFGENILTQGVERISQIRPKGTNTSAIDALDLQFSHFVTEDAYLYLEGDIGYRGLPLYNQVLGGMGYRIAAGARFQFYGQVAAGSGGYAADIIDTGPGLLVHPKVTAEYLIDRNWGLALSAGYLFAPRGTSKNATIGAALSYHPYSAQRPPFPDGGDVAFEDQRLSLYVQSEEKVKVGGLSQNSVHLLSGQYDTIISRHWYVPVQASIAFNEFLGYPGYGEVLAGLGAQSPDDARHRFQAFAQVLLGSNVHGVILKPEAGLYCAMGPHMALRGHVGKTVSLGNGDGSPSGHKLRSDSIGLGLSYRFSLPG